MNKMFSARPASPLDEAMVRDWHIIRDRDWDWHDQHLIVRPFVDGLIAEIERLRAAACTPSVEKEK